VLAGKAGEEETEVVRGRRKKEDRQRQLETQKQAVRKRADLESGMDWAEVPSC